MLFSGGLIPFFLVVRDLGLLNTRWALIIPVALSIWEFIDYDCLFKDIHSRCPVGSGRRWMVAATSAI